MVRFEIIPISCFIRLVCMFFLLLQRDLLPLVRAVDQSITWAIPNGGATSIPTRTAKVGDTFTFVFPSGFHNVYIHPREDCNPLGSMLVGHMGEGRTKYTFLERDIGVRVFACQVSTHCLQGQIMNVIVSPADPPVTTEPDGNDEDDKDTIDEKLSTNTSFAAMNSFSNTHSGGLLMTVLLGTSVLFFAIMAF